MCSGRCKRRVGCGGEAKTEEVEKSQSGKKLDFAYIWGRLLISAESPHQGPPHER